MFHRYREIFYGILIGLGAAGLDTLIDARIEQNSFWDEVSQHPSMMLYRAIFLAFGLVIGWLVWRNRRQERNFQHAIARAEQFHRECDKHALLINSRVQLLLTRDDLHLSREAQELVRSVYERSQQLQTLVRDAHA